MSLFKLLCLKILLNMPLKKQLLKDLSKVREIQCIINYYYLWAGRLIMGRGLTFCSIHKYRLSRLYHAFVYLFVSGDNVSLFDDLIIIICGLQ